MDDGDSMAEKLVVACVQQRMRLPQTLDEHRSDLQRFMRAAQNKNARLVVFPELAGLMLALPQLADFRSTLLKRADRGRRRSATFFQRMAGALSNSTASLLRADLRNSIGGLLEIAAPEMWESYVGLYGGLAREYGVTIVAPSAYLPDPFDGVIRNLAGVFGPSGELLGTQAKVLLHPEDQDLAQAGSAWDVIQSDVGRIGLMLGSDVLYPEVGRLLAYQGAEMLICQGACPDAALYNKIRAGMLARMQDNQLFGMVSFLVGSNELSRRQRNPYMGKSAIFAPQELTPRFSGVLVEMGNQRSEGVLTADWDFVELRQLWDTSDTPVRQQLPPRQLSKLMATLYARLQDADYPKLAADTPSQEVKAVPALQSLDDLAVLASVTSKWPLPSLGPDNGIIDEEWVDISTWRAEEADGNRRRPSSVATDDETDEMDALPSVPQDE